MKMMKYMLSGALAGYAMGCKMEMLRRSCIEGDRYGNHS